MAVAEGTLHKDLRFCQILLCPACPQAQGIQLRRKPAQFLTCQFPHGFPFRLSIHVWFYYTTAFSPRQAPITRTEARTQVLASLRCHISQP